MARRDRRSTGICFATPAFVLHLDERAPATPRLPQRRAVSLPQLAASVAVHVVLAFMVSVIPTPPPGRDQVQAGSATEQPVHLVFLTSASPRMGSGGGGGGNRQPGPIRRAQGVGSNAITLRTRQTPPAPFPIRTPSLDDAPPIPSIVLDAKPLASGTFEQIGLTTGVVLSGTSSGSGSGGGVGTGIGTGMGSGRGPGLGPGSGGGAGGGVYRPGGAVSPPRVIKEVKPRYTRAALLNKIQGVVVLEVLVTREGCPTQIRVVSSLDRGGLDEEAVTAVSGWQFEPGRMANVPVDVLVIVELTFSIR
ncbi:MAG TPA: energy transducer TonB [Vicinamibacterales bacterium]|nr:energy transducer TonB [Vicinamibacterales bacterium]